METYTSSTRGIVALMTKYLYSCITRHTVNPLSSHDLTNDEESSRVADLKAFVLERCPVFAADAIGNANEISCSVDKTHFLMFWRGLCYRGYVYEIRLAVFRSNLYYIDILLCNRMDSASVCVQRTFKAVLHLLLSGSVSPIFL